VDSLTRSHIRIDEGWVDRQQPGVESLGGEQHIAIKEL
jgi:hypothetical protein